jgi:HK97 family phage prohead protease
MNTEKRYTTQKLTFRAAPAASGSIGTLSGYAAVFNTLSRDLGGFVERINPGAFDEVLSANPDCRFLVNHDPNNVLGRTKSGTLRLHADNHGLRFECDLPDTQLGRDIRVQCMRGDMDECSFAFRCDGGDSYSQNGGETVRTISSFTELLDCSIVTYPAYPGTSASARSRSFDYSAPQPRVAPSDEELREAVYGVSYDDQAAMRWRAKQLADKVAKDEYDDKVAEFVASRPPMSIVEKNDNSEEAKWLHKHTPQQ